MVVCRWVLLRVIAVACVLWWLAGVGSSRQTLANVPLLRPVTLASLAGGGCCYGTLPVRPEGAAYAMLLLWLLL